MRISKRVASLQGSKIRRLFELASTIDEPYDLSLGVPSLEIPDSVKQAAVREILSDRKGYSVNAGFLDVRRKIAEKLISKNKIKAVPEEIIITSGVAAGLWLALASIVEEGDEVILFDPYFVPYPGLIEFLGGNPVKVSTYPDWELPFDVLRKAITPKTKAIIFNNPNNPTGKTYSAEDLAKLAQIAEEKDILIISDEIYEDIVFLRPHTSMASIYPSTITLMGPSKSASLSGLRVGYLHGPEELISEINKLQQLFYVCAPMPSQMALSASLELDYGPVANFYKKKRDKVKEVLGDYPGLEGAFYAYLPAPNGDSEKFAEELLKDKVLAVPGTAFSDRKSHFRISYSVPDEKLEAALKLIKSRL